MKERGLIRGMTAVLLVCGTVASACAAEPELPNPRLPVPEHVSPQAQAILAKPVDMTMANAPVPQTAEEWRAWRAGIELRFQSSIGPMLKQAGVVVTKSELAGVTIREIVPAAPRKPHPNRVLMQLHGGGYTINGGDLSVLGGVAMAAAGYRVISVDYRMPPDHPFPAAVDDGVAVYRELLKTIPASGIGILGGSAGGGLAAAVTLAARDAGLTMPGAVVMHTPWTDLTKTGDSYFSNAGVDPVLTQYEGGLEAGALIYANGTDLRHPLLSPVYADYTKGFPPSLLSTGTRDLFLSNTVRLHRALRGAGIPAELHVFEAMWHGLSTLPVEGKELQRESLEFLGRHLSD